jgi:hypothetical protein
VYHGKIKFSEVAMTPKRKFINNRFYWYEDKWEKHGGKWKKRSRYLGRTGPGFAGFLIAALRGNLPTHDLQKLLEMKARAEAKDRKAHEPKGVKLPAGKPTPEDWQKIGGPFHFEHGRYESIQAASEGMQRQAHALYEAANRDNPPPFQAPREELLAKAAEFDTKAMVLGAAMSEVGIAPQAASTQQVASVVESETPALSPQPDEGEPVPAHDEGEPLDVPEQDVDQQPDVAEGSTSSNGLE